MKRYLLFGGDTYYPSGGGLDFKGFFESEEAARESFSDWPEDWGQIFEARGNDLYRVGFYGRNMNHPCWPETEEREKTWMQDDYDRSPIGTAGIYATEFEHD